MRNPCSRHPSLEASRVAPAGSSKVSPCQCKGMVAPGSSGKFLPGLVREPNRKPADLVLRALRHARAERIGEQLRTETDPHHFFPRLQRLADEPALRLQPRMIAVLIDVHLAAHDREQIERGGRLISAMQVRHVKRMTPGRGPVSDFARTLGGGVLKHGDVHASFCSSAICRVRASA